MLIDAGKLAIQIIIRYLFFIILRYAAARIRNFPRWFPCTRTTLAKYCVWKGFTEEQLPVISQGYSDGGSGKESYFAGYGNRYIRTLKQPHPGDRVWVKIPATGYAGAGIVQSTVEPAGLSAVPGGRTTWQKGISDGRADYGTPAFFHTLRTVKCWLIIIII